ncbi:replication initiation protein RepM, partial [Acinetobacter pecorum]
GVRDFDEENFRNIFELQDKYSLLWNLKKRVIVPAVLEINKSTELQVSFENIKEGKKITGFRFFISRKKTKKLSDPVKEKKSLRIPTERQRQLFASKLSELPEMGKYSQGTESYQQFAVRIAEMLKDPEKINELFPLLRKVGFK